MALILDFKVCMNSLCDTATITDLTSAYSGITPGGYGTPNPAILDVTTSTIQIAKRGIDGTWTANTIIDIYPDLPSASAGSVDIDTNEYTSGFWDGVYRFIYTITGEVSQVPFTYSKTIYRPISCAAKCCWQKLEKKIATCCTDEIMDKQRRVATLMRALEGSCDCGDLTKMQNIINELNNICKSCGCNCSK